MRKVRPALRVRGSRNFLAVLESLSRNSEEYKAIDDALSTLKENIFAGIQVPRRQWPKAYITRYGITNLYKFDLPKGRRLTYTIVAEENGLSVIMLDYFPSHGDYELFFGY